MTAATLFSGIGAPEQAMPGWSWLWHAEIEKFPAAVLAVRHGESVNLGDVTADDFCERALAVGRPDVLVFGSPCQSYSVAGKRLGLDDPRGNLALVALGIIARVRPRWFVFENVPGLLSSWSGAEAGPDGADEWEGQESSDFDAFLATVDELGASLAWCVLDAQYFGVAQRRERVFAVGSFGDWRGPAAVLLEPDSVLGHSPARGEAGEGVAGTVSARTRGGGGLGTDFELGGGLVASDVSPTLRAGGNHTGGHRPPGTDVDTVETLIATTVSHSLRGEGFDASEDGTGRVTPIVPVVAKTLTSGGNGARGCLDPVNTDLVAYAIQAGAVRENPNSGPGGVGVQSGTAYTLEARSEVQAGAFSAKDNGGDASIELSPTLRSGNHSASHANGGVMPAVAFTQNQCGDILTGDISPSMGTNSNATGRNTPKALQGMAVRRLTPRECERLQGFPDDYTAITYKGKPAADGPRYKAIGNSMAVPVVRWILERIETVDLELRA